MANELPQRGFDFVTGLLGVLGVLGDSGLGKCGEAQPLLLLGVPFGPLLVGPVAGRDGYLGVVGVRKAFLQVEQFGVRVVGSLLRCDQFVGEFDCHKG